LLNLDEVRTRLSVLEQAQVAGQVAVAPAEAAPLGLTPGTTAPDFSLPDLQGTTRTLADFVGGRPLLMIFFSPTCGFCQQMAPRLGELSDDGPRVLLVSQGDAETIQALANEHGWTCDVVLEKGEVMMAYGGRGTPTGYLIGTDGVIATDLAMGAEALLALHEAVRSTVASNGHGDLTAEKLREKEGEVLERARSVGLPVRDLSESKIKRDGLGAGTVAPDFTLPDLKGSRRSLKRFRGRRVLLVFSDVGCGPCEALVPDLNRIQQEHRNDNLEVVMVSRGDVDENKKKAKELDIKFPVLLQKGWEVSKDYAMFATPVAYLIDEDGVITNDVAVGANSILELV
jgi:peroxiredoxin